MKRDEELEAVQNLVVTIAGQEAGVVILLLYFSGGGCEQCVSV